MHSPVELAARLTRQWQNPDLRESRLGGDEDWPVRLPIGRPPAKLVTGDWLTVAGHIKRWRSVRVGLVVWQPVNYRATGEAIEVPVSWEIPDAGAWAEATADPGVAAESATLARLLAASDPLFHTLLIRQRSIWSDKAVEETRKALLLGALLEPGCANGAPLRALSLGGIDSKFFERNRGLIIRLLDLRFDGEVSRQGLETFLNAWRESDHWLLMVDLDGGLLPFSQQRVRSSELAMANLMVPRLLIVENERCLHLLPRPLSGCVAILGAGNNLHWLSAPWVQRAQVVYWGDIDTWGLTLLANARKIVPGLKAILMDRGTFEDHAREHAVSESVTAGTDPPGDLLSSEKDLYVHLHSCDRGRIEQEFIRAEDVAGSLLGEFL